MSTNNKKSVATQALLEMDAITSAIKEESKKSLNTLLSEAVREALREKCEDEDEYEVIDSEKEDAKEKGKSSKKSSKSNVDEDDNEEMDYGAQQAQSNDKAPMAPQSPADGEAQEAPMGAEGGEKANVPAEQGEGEGDGAWNEFSKYQVGDDTYDLTGENDYDNVVKVYKLLNDTDQVVVKRDGNTLELKDGAAGTDYVIDLGGDDEDVSAEAVEGEEQPEGNLNEEAGDEFAGFYDDDDDEFDSDEDDVMNGSQPWDDDEEDEFEISFDDEDDADEDVDDNIFGDHYAEDLDSELDADNDEEFDDDASFGELAENYHKAKKARKPMKESKEVLFEVDLGYTDNYQDKDPIAGLSNSEPSKSGKSWHKGVPSGTEKPWAGKSKSKSEPFGKQVDNCEEPILDAEEATVDEATNVGGAVQQRSMGAKSHIPANRKEHGPKPKHHVSTEGQYDAVVAENKELKKAILALRKNLNEAYMTNVNLGRIAKLFVENTTSKAEKIDIVNRFSNEAKTVEQSNALYESIKKNLNSAKPMGMNINESSVTAKGTQALNENKVYQSNDLLKTIDLMKRVLDC